jgi:hypothetical protein
MSSSIAAASVSLSPDPQKPESFPVSKSGEEDQVWLNISRLSKLTFGVL